MLWGFTSGPCGTFSEYTAVSAVVLGTSRSQCREPKTKTLFRLVVADRKPTIFGSAFPAAKNRPKPESDFVFFLGWVFISLSPTPITPAKYDEGTIATNHNAATRERGYYNITSTYMDGKSETPTETRPSLSTKTKNKKQKPAHSQFPSRFTILVPTHMHAES